MMIRETDQAIIKVLQEAYNKVWDYTGLTKGMIKITINSAVLLAICLSTSGFSWITPFFIGIILHSIYRSFGQHEDQIKGKFAKINRNAEDEQSDIKWIIFRLPVALILDTFLLSMADHIDLYTLFIVVLFTSIMLFLFYLECLYVRDREPPGKLDYASGSI